MSYCDGCSSATAAAVRLLMEKLPVEVPKAMAAAVVSVARYSGCGSQHEGLRALQDEAPPLQYSAMRTGVLDAAVASSSSGQPRVLSIGIMAVVCACPYRGGQWLACGRCVVTRRSAAGCWLDPHHAAWIQYYLNPDLRCVCVN